MIGHKLIRNIDRKETIHADRAGWLLLPAPYGFKIGDNRYRLVTSYLPDFQFRYMAAAAPHGPWKDIWNNFMQMTPQIFSAGIAPNLFVVDSSSGKAMHDTDAKPSASYDSIRVYLWASMSGKSGKEMVKLLPRFAELIRQYGVPPEMLIQ